MDLQQLMKKSEAKILTLHPSMQNQAFELIKRSYKEGIYILITHGLRTMEEQQKLYDQGRKSPGNIVTNAKPGQSFHNYALAFDFAVYSDLTCRAINWTVDSKWKRVGAIGELLGLEWGGNWNSFKDYPHFQIRGLTLSDLQRGVRPQAPTAEQPKEEPRRKKPMEPWLKEALIKTIKEIAEKELPDGIKINSPDLWIEKVEKDEDVAPLALILINHMLIKK